MFSYKKYYFILSILKVQRKFNPIIFFLCNFIPPIVCISEPGSQGKPSGRWAEANGRNESHLPEFEICAHCKVKCNMRIQVQQWNWAFVDLNLGEEEWKAVVMYPLPPPHSFTVKYLPFPQHTHCHHSIVYSCPPLSKLWVEKWFSTSGPRSD